MSQIDPDKAASTWHKGNADTDGVTLVALWGNRKQRTFEKLLVHVADSFQRALWYRGSWFEFYPLEQIHATILGLEGCKTETGIVNENFQKRLERSAENPPRVNFEGLLQAFRDSSWPVGFQLGGYKPSDRNPYDPERSPYSRSFEIRPDGLVVMMAWPLLSQAKPFAPFLIGIRKYAEKFGVVHKYHLNPTSQDNDLFFVIGRLNHEKWSSASDLERKALQSELDTFEGDARAYLSENPIDIDITLEDLWFVQYLRTTLAKTSFEKQVRFAEARELKALYR